MVNKKTKADDCQQFNEPEIRFLIEACHAYIRDYQMRGGTGYWRWRDRANEMLSKLQKMLETLLK